MSGPAQTPISTSGFAPAGASRGRLLVSPRPHAGNFSRRCVCLRAKRRETVAGIDLGTTNSAVAVVEDGEPAIVPDASGRLLVPSVVALTADGDTLVGWPARKHAATDPRNTFHSVKRFIGKPLSECGEDQAAVAFALRSDEDGTVMLASDRVPEGRLYPEEVSGAVLSQLLDQVADAYGDRPTKAVVGVPAYFSEAQREATLQAGMCAGLEVVRLIHEPVAAALAYGVDLKEDRTVLVFDLGGGTYDVSILEVGNGVVEVLATGGDPHLGGDDFDAAIARWLGDEHLRPRGVDPGDPAVASGLRAVAEAAKVRLSSVERVAVAMPLPGGGRAEAVVTRQKVEELCGELFRRARLPLDQCCWQAGVDLGSSTMEGEYRGGKLVKVGEGQGAVRSSSAARKRSPDKGDGTRRQPLSEVLLVGGATRMPAVRRFVRNMTGVEPRESAVDPDLAVALGAAVQAGIYQGEVAGLMVIDPWKAALMRAFAARALERGEVDPAAVGVEVGEEDVGDEVGEEGEGDEDGDDREREVGEGEVGDAWSDDESDGEVAGGRSTIERAGRGG